MEVGSLGVSRGAHLADGLAKADGDAVEQHGGEDDEGEIAGGAQRVAPAVDGAARGVAECGLCVRCVCGRVEKSVRPPEERTYTRL